MSAAAVYTGHGRWNLNGPPHGQRTRLDGEHIHRARAEAGKRGRLDDVVAEENVHTGGELTQRQGYEIRGVFNRERRRLQRAAQTPIGLSNRLQTPFFIFRRLRTSCERRTPTATPSNLLSGRLYVSVFSRANDGAPRYPAALCAFALVFAYPHVDK